MLCLVILLGLDAAPVLGSDSVETPLVPPDVLATEVPSGGLGATPEVLDLPSHTQLSHPGPRPLRCLASPFSCLLEEPMQH